jgi:hypothetical protein
MGIFALISNAFGAVKNYFGWAQDRQAAKNAPEVKANAAAEVREAIRTEATQAVAKGDEDAIRKQLADQ